MTDRVGDSERCLRRPLKAESMVLPLHEGHEQTEAAASAAGPELLVVSVIGFLIVAAALGYVVNQYTGA